jgi:hypothetical protein
MDPGFRWDDEEGKPSNPQRWRWQCRLQPLTDRSHSHAQTGAMRILIAPDHCGEAVEWSDNFCPQCGHSTWARPWWRYVLPTLAVAVIILWQWGAPPVQRVFADLRTTLGI